MSAEAATDSGAAGVSTTERKARKSSSAPGVFNINDLGKYLHTKERENLTDPVSEQEGTKIAVAAETQKLGWWDLIGTLP